MTLRLYNTADRKKETFHPVKEGRAGIYVCGVTVYDLCHIGHARSAIVFDVLVRYLRAKGLDVTYVRNFTDVDDKIIKRARETGRETALIAQENIDAFYEDMDSLYVLRADAEPRATEHIEGMIDMIAVLIQRGHAYVEGGDVFFSVKSFKGYGRLSGGKLDDMQAGSRIAVDEKKRHPMDFVLWKGVKPDEPQWQSPWGPGRPGWHLECSVMSNHFLGPSFDIHGGGRDLLFPHHENERAQSLCANDGSFARYWVHNGFVTVEGEKMSKSLGNFLTIRDALKLYHPQVLRFFLLSRHYRSPLDFSKSAVFGSRTALVRIYRTLQRMDDLIGPFGEKEKEIQGLLLTGDSPLHADLLREPFVEQFINVMDDDLNTAGAVGLVFEKVREINRVIDSGHDSLDKTALDQLANERRQLFLTARILGLLEETPDEFFSRLAVVHEPLDSLEIENMIKERSKAKEEKNWVKADEIRDRLKEMGVVLEDGPEETIWRYDV